MSGSLCVSSQEAVSIQEVLPKYRTSRLAPTNSLPPVRLHLIRVPRPSKSVPPAKDQVSEPLITWEMLCIQAAAPLVDTRMPSVSLHTVMLGRSKGKSFDVATPLFSLGMNSACARELLPTPGFLFGESVCFHLLGPCH